MSPLLRPVPALALIALSALGCGSGFQDSRMVLEPSSPATKVGTTLPLSAVLTQEVVDEPEWEIQEPYGGGLLRSQGLRTTYVPPPMAGTYHLVLRAHLASGSLLKRTFAVTVLPDPVLKPASAQMAPGATLSFTAHMNGVGRQGVAWSVAAEDGGDAGVITDTGTFTAPGRPAEVTVRATSTFNPSVVAEATVLVGR